MVKNVHFLAVVAISGIGSLASAWDAYAIRSNPTINETAGTTEFIISASGMKGGLGSSELDGHQLSDLLSASIVRLDNTARFAAGSGPALAPYINIWITDGTNFAVIANEPTNGEWAGKQWNFTWDDLKTKTCKVYENLNTSWLPNSGVGLKFNDLAGYTVLAPTSAQLTAGWAGLGTGAPREIGTNQAYGFNWIFGDTLSNYVSGQDGYIVKDPKLGVAGASAVPGPAAALAFGIGLFGAARKRRASK